MNFKTLTLILTTGISASAFGQGVILQNVGTGDGGTNGAVFIPPGFIGDGIADNFGVEVWGGPDFGSLHPLGLGTYTVQNDPKGYTGSDLGTFQLGAAGQAVNIPGVAPGGVAAIWLNIWYDGANGLFPSFAAACAGGGFVGSVTFRQNTGNPPLVPPPSLNGMPDVFLFPGTCTPEPSTMGLTGLGLAVIWMLHRHNSAKQMNKPKP